MKIGDLIAVLRADTSNFKKGLASATANLSSFKKSIVGVSALTVVSVGAMSTAMFKLGKASLETAGDYEQTTIAFQTMIGDVEKANKLLAELTEMAVKTPFGLEEMEMGAKRLMAYGVEAEELIPTMSMIGDVTSALGRDKLPQLILAFGQIRAKGRLMGTELRQLTETGFNLAEAMGITHGELEELISQGDVSFEDVEQAFKDVTSEGGRFYNMMAEQNKTYLGQVEELQDGWVVFKREIGKELIPVAIKLVNFLSDVLLPALYRLSDFLKNNKEVVIGVATALTALMIPAIYVLTTAIAGFLGITGAMVVTALAFVGVAIAIGVAVGLIVKYWDEIVAFFKNTASSIAKWFTDTKESVSGFFTNIWNKISTAISNITDKITNFVKKIFKPFRVLGDAMSWWWNNVTYPLLYLMFAVISRIFYEIYNFIEKIMTWVWEKVIEPIWEAVSKFVGERVEAIYEAVILWFNRVRTKAKIIWLAIKRNIIEPISSAINTALDWLKKMFNGAKDWLERALQSVKDWGEKMKEHLVKPFKWAKEKIEKWAEKIKELADKISPYHKESPSLVEKVQKGVGEIVSAYAQLSQVSVPSVSANISGSGIGGKSVSVVQNVTVYPQDELDIQQLSDKLAFGLRTSV